MPGADHSSMVSVLGGFHLWWSGSVQVGIPRASQRLLALLAFRSGVISRASIAGTLWPDATEARAYSNLRAALARLERTHRKMLQASKLELGLAEGVTVDIHHAQTLARRLLDPAATLEQTDLSPVAIMALSGDLLPGWYDDWVLIEAEDWRQLRLHALEALAGRLKQLTPPVRPCGRTRSEKAPMLLSSTFTWPRATSRKRCASSHTTGRCCTLSSALSPPCDCVALSSVYRARAGTLRSRPGSHNRLATTSALDYSSSELGSSPGHRHRSGRTFAAPLMSPRIRVGPDRRREGSVVAAVQAWLSEVLADSLTGDDDPDSLSDT
jgi:hypothetical protein